MEMPFYYIFNTAILRQAVLFHYSHYDHYESMDESHVWLLT